jgi:hypothetical protein
MRCPACQSDQLEDSNFCDQCGKELTQNDNRPSVPRSRFYQKRSKHLECSNIAGWTIALICLAWIGVRFYEAGKALPGLLNSSWPDLDDSPLKPVLFIMGCSLAVYIPFFIFQDRITNRFIRMLIFPSSPGPQSGLNTVPFLTVLAVLFYGIYSYLFSWKP